MAAILSDRIARVPSSFFLPPQFKKLYVSGHTCQLVGAIQFFHTIKYFSLEVQFSRKVLVLKNDIMERKMLPSGGFF
jgi:hypothetical protein